LEILLVEDNNADVLLLTEALKESTIIKKYYVVKDGEEALKFLNRTDEYSKTRIPDVILLDLKLPKKDGFEVLKYIKKNPELQKIPVVILSSSGNEEDIKKCYELHANCYIPKPIELENFEEIIKTIESFWGEVASLPSIN
jgi:chemotaxis family two-component system response regulator Rcp1